MAKILVELDDGHAFETTTEGSVDVGARGKEILGRAWVVEPGDHDRTFFLHPVSRVKRLTIET